MTAGRPAYCCGVCLSDPTWRIERRGDAVVSWACDDDLATECHNLRRDWERTELVISSFYQAGGEGGSS